MQAFCHTWCMSSPENLGRQFDGVKMTPMMKKVHDHMSFSNKGFSNRGEMGEIASAAAGYGGNSSKEISALNAIDKLRSAGLIRHTDDVPEEHGLGAESRVWVPVEGESTDEAARLRAKYGVK